MAELFATILNMSLTAGIIILIVLLARLCLRTAPKIYSYLLWAVVLFRLLCSVSLSLPVSVLAPVSEASTSAGTIYTASMEYISIPERTGTEHTYQQASGEPVVHDEQTNTVAPAPPASGEGQSKITVGEIVLTILGWVWVAGMACVLGFTIWQTVCLHRMLADACIIRGNIFESDKIDTAFILGVFNPKIYLPLDLPFDIQKAVVAHEQTHQRRGDHIVKLVSYFALAIHWFNPLVWLSFKLMCDDMEKSCDEAVIRTMNDRGYSIDSTKKAYGHMLLALGGGNQHIFSPVSFAENSTKSRVKNVVAYNRIARNMGIALASACALIALLCAVNPSNTAKAARHSSDSMQLTIADVTFQSDVTELDLSGHRLDDISVLAQCTHLEKLNLSDTHVKDISVLADIPTLRQLDLSNNRAGVNAESGHSISDLSVISRLTQIMELDLSNVGMIDISFLKDMTNLRVLNLNNNIIVSLSPLESLSNLTELHLGNVIYSGEVSFPQGLANLEILDMSGAQNSGLEAQTTYCNKLRYLDISHHDIDDISFISSFSELRYLNLSNTLIRHDHNTGKQLPVSPDVLAPISECSKLEELVLSGLKFSDISFIKSLLSLKKLRFSAPGTDYYNPDDSEKQEVWIPDASPLENMTGLTELYIAGMGITDISFVEGMSNLEVLDVSNNHIKSYKPLDGKSELKELNLTNNMNVSDGLFPQGLNNLEVLSISDGRFLHQITYCSKLRYLDAGGTGDEGGVDFSLLPNLEYLNIGTVTEDSVKAIGQLSGLKELYLDLSEEADANTCFKELCNLTQLRKLRFGVFTEFNDLSGISGMVNLEEFELRYSQINDISGLSNLKKLKHLDLAASSQLSDISPLAGLTELEYLCLAGCSISNITPLASMNKLVLLFLDNNSISDVSALSGLEGFRSGVYVSNHAGSTVTNRPQIYLSGNDIPEEQITSLVQSFNGNCEVLS